MQKFQSLCVTFNCVEKIMDGGGVRSWLLLGKFGVSCLCVVCVLFVCCCVFLRRWAHFYFLLYFNIFFTISLTQHGRLRFCLLNSVLFYQTWLGWFHLGCIVFWIHGNHFFHVCLVDWHHWIWGLFLVQQENIWRY